MVKQVFLNRRGFTLIEMMTIVVIIGIVSAMAFPKFGAAMHRLEFRNAGRHMVSKLRLARSTAISQKQQYGVSFDDQGTTMTLFLDTNNPSMFLFDGGDSVVSVDTLPADFSWVWAELGNYIPTVIFKPNGAAHSAAPRRIRFLSINPDDYIHFGTIELTPATGRTKLTSLDGY
ncbi:MAG: prepilin-type N-terminal cleavage/methylation domain-containing protein [FCB group bacterium]|nr:prepilin-type N-terminal cleavage/methylation domain-containing protein [FCB group bacterium]